MTSAPLLFPRDARRMKQPTKADLREHLQLAADEIIRLNRIVLAVEDAMKPFASTAHVSSTNAPAVRDSEIFEDATT